MSVCHWAVFRWWHLSGPATHTGRENGGSERLRLWHLWSDSEWGMIDGASLRPLSSCCPLPSPRPVPPSISAALFSCLPRRRRGHKLISIVSWQVPQCHVFIEQFLQRLPRVKASPRRGVNYRPLADDTEQKGNHRENNEASCNALKWESLLNLSVFCLLWEAYSPLALFRTLNKKPALCNRFTSAALWQCGCDRFFFVFFCLTCYFSYAQMDNFHISGFDFFFFFFLHK